MVIIAFLLIGALWGVFYVRKRNGTGFDMLQYAAVWGLIGAILGMFATLGLERLL